MVMTLSAQSSNVKIPNQRSIRNMYQKSYRRRIKSVIKVKIQSERIKRHIVKEDELKSSLNKLYNIIWSQCSDQLQATVKFLDDYNTKEEGKDIVWLLTQLQRETAGIDSLGNRHIALIKTLRTLINMRQGADESDDGCLKRMKTMLNHENLLEEDML